jgi:hypothetical protein
MSILTNQLGTVDPPNKIPKADMWVRGTEGVRDQTVSQLGGIKSHERCLGMMLDFSIVSPDFLVDIHNRDHSDQSGWAFASMD